MPDTDTEPSSSAPPPWQKALKRYGPFAAVVLLVVGAIAVFGRGGDDDDDGGGGGGGESAAGEAASGDDLIRSGPMTPLKAELEGRDDVDFGPNCDDETGQLRLPTIYAAPCVEPFEGDNGGDTTPGVTADSIKLVAYVADPDLDPLGAAMIQGAGASLDPADIEQTIQDYVDLYNTIYETYGRAVDLEFFIGTGASDDQEAARADAIAIAERQPFAVIGGPLQAREAYIEVLTAEGVVCPPGCAAAQNDGFISERDPLVHTLGPTANQGALLAAELISNLAGPGPAELAGDEAMHTQDRVYAIVHYDTPDGDQQEAYEQLRTSLEDQGIEIETDIEFFLDFERIAENARTIIAQLEQAGVTTVIFYGDPLMPAELTNEATRQGYNPEWILGPNALADTALFARRFDPEQWSHGFGIALSTTPAVDQIGDSYMIYEWAFGGPPPSNIYGVLEPPLRYVFDGIHLAGENLTPDTFRDGLYRLPVRGGGPTRARISFGEHDLWPGADYGSADDAAVIWWDPEAEGTDEVGQQGPGMYRFANGGERYTTGNFPETAEEAGLFDVESSEISITELPEEDRPPDYPAPDL
jgi:hypothetical protein